MSVPRKMFRYLLIRTIYEEIILCLTNSFIGMRLHNSQMLYIPWKGHNSAITKTPIRTLEISIHFCFVFWVIKEYNENIHLSDTWLWVERSGLRVLLLLLRPTMVPVLRDLGSESGSYTRQGRLPGKPLELFRRRQRLPHSHRKRFPTPYS